MADKPEKKEEPPVSKKRFPMTIGIVVGVAVLEAAAFLAVFKLSGSGPEPARAEGSHEIEPTPASQPAAPVEVAVVRNLRVLNDKSGHSYMYDLDISVVVPASEKERTETLVRDRSGEIGDRIAGILRGATERMLREDDLRALRQQILEALREISGDQELVQRVLIPRFVPMRAD